MQTSNVSVKRIVIRMMLLTGIWFLFTGWSALTWIVGIPVVMASLVVSLALPASPFLKMHPAGAAGFLIYFIKQSFLGGIDVAWRAIHPRCPISPGFIQYDVRLANDFAVVVFANTISLLPGTLSVDLKDKQVTIHALDQGNDIKTSLSQLERRVAKLFGEEVAND